MRSGDMRSRPLIERYAKDVMREPLYAMLEGRTNWINLSFLLWLVVFAAGFGAAVIWATPRRRLLNSVLTSWTRVARSVR